MKPGDIITYKLRVDPKLTLISSIIGSAYTVAKNHEGSPVVFHSVLDSLTYNIKGNRLIAVHPHDSTYNIFWIYEGDVIKKMKKDTWNKPMK